MIRQYFIKKNQTIPKIPPNVSCIGFFDGVHLGHQALIAKTIEEAKKLDVEPYLITFYPDPVDVISNKETEHINSLKRRMELFEMFGIKGVIIIEFDKEIMSMPDKEFVNRYLKNLNLKGIVCGFDFHYGYKGLGSHKTLSRDLKNICPVYKIDEVSFYGKKVSSTRIKEVMKKGNYHLANRLLGYEYK